MLFAVLIAECRACDGVPFSDYLVTLAGREDGVIIIATLLLFPTSLALYGGMIVFFAAKEFVEKRAASRARREERQRIRREMEKLGAPLTPEQVRILADENEPE